MLAPAMQMWGACCLSVPTLFKVGQTENKPECLHTVVSSQTQTLLMHFLLTAAAQNDKQIEKAIKINKAQHLDGVGCVGVDFSQPISTPMNPLAKRERSIFLLLPVSSRHKFHCY